jgi:pimeloyl-ACP methyl ester carboxylesterase
MKKIRTNYCAISFIIAQFIINSGTNAQEPVAPTGKFATVKDLKIYYEDTGRGMPLLLLHGFTGTCSQWKAFIPEFSKSYRVIAIDLPGHGRSDYMDTTEVYSHKRAAEYIIALFDELKIDSLYVIGGSSGGMITLYMATLRTDLAKKIIVVAGQVYFSSKTRNLITSIGPGTEDPKRLEPIIKTHGKVKGTLLLRQFWNFRKLYGDPAFTPDVLSTIKAKTLIIHGDNDPIAPVTNAWEMYQYIPKVNLWIVPNGGHGFIFDPANDTDFIRRVLEFLRGDWEKN